MMVAPPLPVAGVGLREIIHAEFIQQCLGPGRAQQTAASTAEARRWLRGLRRMAALRARTQLSRHGVWHA